MRYALGVLGAAFVLSFATLAILPQGAEGAPHVLPPDKARLVAEKEQARQAAGAPQLTQTGPFIGPNEPNRPFTAQTVTRRIDMEAQLRSAVDARIAVAEQVGDTAAAQVLRAQLDEQLTQIQALPEIVVRDVAGIEIGRRSYQVSTFTDDYFVAKDPINTFFYRQGTAFSVQYDMKNWTSQLWANATTGAPQRVYIWDQIHTGGWNGWRGDQYQLKPVGAPEYPDPRYHIRLFGAFVQDSHVPGAGYWSVGDAHYDNQGHNCSSWESAEIVVRNSFRDGSGNPLWFVAQVYTSWFGNAGNFQCGYNDGYATFVDLLY